MILMYFIVAVVIILLAILLINTYYLKVVHVNSQENHILRGLKGKYDAIALGSAYCRYGIDFSKTNVNGYNFGYASQFFYYTDIMLKYIAPKCLNSGGTVYIIIADLVFASVGKKELNYKGMMRFLPYRVLDKEHSLGEYIKSNYPAFFNISVYKDSIKFFIKSLIGKENLGNEYETLMVNPLSEAEVEKAAINRCLSWCDQFNLANTKNSDFSPKLLAEFKKTQYLLTSMISFCIENGYNPILVITPVSDIMNNHLGSNFINNILINNINDSNIFNIPVYNYLHDSRFKSFQLYFRNADFLNIFGRKLFTEILLHDSLNKP